MSDLICVTNRLLCKDDFFARIERIAACAPAGIILREKDLSGEAYRRLAVRVMEICESYQVPCIWHSFISEAIAAGADRIHLPLHLLRGMREEYKRHFSVIGASCHSADDAREAQRLGCTYLTAGHVFATDCKKGLSPRGIPFLREVCESVSIPVYGIGGISGGNADAVRGAGAKGVCVMSGLMCCEDVAAYFASFRRDMEQTDR